MSEPSLRLISPARVRHVLQTLLFASAVCGLMWLVRAYVSHTGRFRFLIWNLFLAWIPLGFALAARWQIAKHGWRFGAWAFAAAWLLFFPNSFYIVTDLIHYDRFGSGGIPRWYDIQMFVAFLCGGVFLGCLSLYLLHLSVRARAGWVAGWAFAVSMLALSALGIYLGRFVRLNSWDLVTRPYHLWTEVGDVLLEESRHTFAFCSSFFLLSLAIYGFVVSMARLHEDTPPIQPGGGESPRGV